MPAECWVSEAQFPLASVQSSAVVREQLVPALGPQGGRRGRTEPGKSGEVYSTVEEELGSGFTIGHVS